MPKGDFNKLHRQRIELIGSGKAEFTQPINLVLKSFEEIVEMQVGCNRCFTLYDLHQGCFVKWHLVKEIFGYVNEEFTIQAVNNFGDRKIIYEEDIEHKIRYDKIIYGIIASEKNFGVRMDNYCLSLRMLDVNRNVLPVRRRSFIFEAKENIPLTQFDEWEVYNRYKVNHVFPELIVSNQQLKDKITEEFYYANLVELNLEFKKDALRVLHYKIKGESNATIAAKINVAEQTVANRHSENCETLRTGFPKEISNIAEVNPDSRKVNSKKDTRENINIFREICKRYGVYPVPESILYVDFSKKGG